MQTISYVIQDKEGIHARPAGELVKLANRFSASILIGKDGKNVDCKKIFGIMGLGVKKGHEVIFIIEGEDEVEAAAAIDSFLRNHL